MNEAAGTSLGGDVAAARHYAAICASSDDAILSKDAEGLITSWNEAAYRLYGYRPEEVIGKPISILIPPDRAGEERRVLDTVLAGGRVEHYETRRVRKDGRIVDIELSVSPIRDDDERIVGASVIARGIADRKRAAERAERLQRITNALGRELAPERVLDVVLTEAGEALGADAATVGLLSEDGDVVELAGSVGYSEAGLSAWLSFPADAEVPMAEAIRTREPIFISSAEQLASRYPVLAGATIRYDSLAVVPLIVEGKALGSIALSFAEEQEFTPEDRAFLVAATQQAAHTLDRARLFEAERTTRARLELLAEASELLAGSLDLETTLQRLAYLVVPKVAEWCGVDLLAADGRLESVAVAHVEEQKVALARELRERYPPDPDADSGSPHVVRTGVPELYPEIDDELLAESARDERHLELLRELDLGSALVVPLQARGRTLGALTLVAPKSGRAYDDGDLAFAADLARRAALAVDNALLYRAEHQAALTLQRGLLPERLPSVPGVELAARYLPAGEGVEVGGDWFDAIRLADSRLALIVGDVAGSGIRAASVMGQLRTALRAYALEGHPPEEAIERLDRLMQDFGRREMATIVHATVDLERRTIRFARAGHPPALVRGPDGEVSELYGTGSRPVGLFEQPACRASEAELPAGSTLLLYTDGLVERRGTSLEAGIGRLREALASAPEPAEECVQALVTELVGAEPEDDVAVLAMRA